MKIKQFISAFSKVWKTNNVCHKCKEIITHPLKNFVDCYLDYGVDDNEELKKACEEYQKATDKLWGLIDDVGFEFKEED